MNIFISYRRDDTGNVAERLAGILSRYFTSVNIVLDVNTFSLGQDFRREIEKSVTESEIILLLIGEFWHSILLGRREDIEQSGHVDYVVFEIETALRHGKVIIPLMIDKGSIPPEPWWLPETIKDIRYRNGVILDSPRSKFSQGVWQLIRRIEADLGISVKPQENTEEYMVHLLHISKWIYTTSINGDDEFICENDNRYRIVVSLNEDSRVENYESEWLNNFPGQHIVYPVYIKLNGEVIETTYFVSIWGAKYLIPLPKDNAFRDEPAQFYWDVKSIEWLISKHITHFDSNKKSMEDFARIGNVRILE